MTNFSPSDTPPDGAGATRRRVICGGVAAFVVVGLSALVWRVWHTVSPVRPRRALLLSTREIAVVNRLARVFFPAGMALGVDATHMDVGGYVDRYVAAMGQAERLMLRGLLLALDQGTLLSGYWRPLRKLDDAAALAYLQRWNDGYAWQHDLVASAQGIVGLAYFAHPEVRSALGVAYICTSQGPSFWSSPTGET